MTMTMILIMTMIMIIIMIMIMIMITIMITTMTMTMVSYRQPDASRAVRGSVVGSSMDMWCPNDIGRESWDREVRRLVDQDPFPPSGEVALGCDAPRSLVQAGRRTED